MKIKKSFIFNIFFALVLFLGCGFAQTANRSASAAGVHTITFNIDGDTTSVSVMQTTDAGILESIPTTSKTGANFAGWYLDGSTEPITTTTEFSENTTVYAKWKYTIRLQGAANYPGCPAAVETGIDGKLSELPNINYEGHVLKGWLHNSTPVTVDYVFTEHTTITPEWGIKTYDYTISNNGEFVSVVGLTDTIDLTYTLGNSITSLSEAFNLIDAELPANEHVGITFNNFVLNETNTTATLNYKNSTISGSITCNDNNNNPLIITNIGSSETTITLNSLSLTAANNTTNLIQVNNPLETQTNLTIQNCSFSSTATNYTFNFDKATNTTLKFIGNNQSTCYLFDYKTGLSIDMTEPLTNTTKLMATADVIHDGVVLATNFHINNINKFGIESTKPSYTAMASRNANHDYIIETLVNLIFDLNGGAYTTAYNQPDFNYDDTNGVAFPTASILHKNHADFGGWFGKVQMGPTTYYFDKLSIMQFMNNNCTATDIPSYFTTDLNLLLSQNALTEYTYGSTSPSFQAVKLAFDYSMVPELVAKWNYHTYRISFVTDGGSSVDTITDVVGATVERPQDPTKTGYTFINWYTDTQYKVVYTFSTMPAYNVTVYAGWAINTYTVTFVPNNGTAETSITAEYGSPFECPTNLEKTGHHIEGWYFDSAFTLKCEQRTIPNADTSLYAKWVKSNYTIIFLTGISNRPTPTPITAEYDSTIEQPQIPTCTGYTFHGWFTYGTNSELVTFPIKMPAKNMSLYEYWTINSYTISFNTNTVYGQVNRSFNYAQEINNIPSYEKKGYKFLGWYTDSSFTEKYTFTTMPASNFALYAKWESKTVIDLDLDTYIYEQNKSKRIELESNTYGVKIEYLVGNEWTTDAPIEIGEYNVRLSRAEDDNYAEYIEVFEKAYVITQKTLNLQWIAYVLFIFFFLEIISVFIIRHVRKVKKFHNISLSILLPWGVLPKNQFILLIVAASLTLFGFILVIVEIVKLHKTVPVKTEVESKYDSRINVEKAHSAADARKIEANVDSLLAKHGFVKPRETATSFYDTVEENEISNDGSLIDEADRTYRDNNNDE